MLAALPGTRRVRSTALALALILLPAAALAEVVEEAPEAEAPAGATDADPPGTRAEALRRQRLAKAALPPRPYRPGFLERQILAFEKAERPSVLDFNVASFYPRFQAIASGSQQAAGLRLWRPDVGGSRFDVHGSAFYSRAGYEFYDLQFGLIPHKGKRFPLRSTKGDDVYELGTTAKGEGQRLILYGSLRYRHYTQLDFFGLGPESRKEDQTTFLQQDAFYDLVAGYQPSRHVAVTVRGGFVQAFVGRGEKDDFPATQDQFDDAAAPGLDEQPDFLRLAAQVFVDFRDQPGNPHRGFMLAVQGERYEERGSARGAGDAWSFDRWAVDARGFLPLGSPQRVLALRTYASGDTPREGGRVPFYFQETLGGSHTLRGFRNFRFRGEKLLLLQAEYRWEAVPALELCLFAEAGQARRRGEDFDWDGLDGDWGFGVRLKTFEAVMLRFDVARSHEDTRLFLRIGSVSY